MNLKVIDIPFFMRYKLGYNKQIMEDRMLKLTPWFLIAITATGCISEKADDQEEEEEEEEEETDTNTDTDSGDTEPPASTLQPDYLLYSLSNAYEGNDISSVIVPGATDAMSGTFSAILYDSALGDFCAVDWEFDATTSDVDPEFADGVVDDSFNEGETLEAWYGFIITSTPTTRGSCDSLDAGYEQTFAGIQAEQPGFGYGPLSPDLEAGMNPDHPSGWDAVAPYVFTGFITTTTLNTDGSRSYMAINQGFAYEITDGTTVWDPSNGTYPQGNEMSVDDVPYAEGWYVSDVYFGLVFQ
jgi:hypothetical protein